jgi:hypothetical protein
MMLSPKKTPLGTPRKARDTPLSPLQQSQNDTDHGEEGIIGKSEFFGLFPETRPINTLTDSFSFIIITCSRYSYAPPQ